MRQVQFRSSWRRLAVVLGVLAAVAPAEAAPVRLPADLNLIQQSGASFACFRLGDLAENELVKAFPERMQKRMAEGLAEMKRGLGVEGTEVDRVSMLIFHENLLPAGVVHTKKPYDRNSAVKNIIRGGEVAEQQHRGKTIYSRAGSEGMFSAGICPIDDRTYLIGLPVSIKKVLDAVAVGKEDPALSDAIGLAAANHHIVLGMEPRKAVMVLGWGVVGSAGTSPAPVDAVPVPAIPAPPPLAPPGQGEIPIAFFQPEEQHEPPPIPPRPTLDEIIDELSPQILPFKPLLLAKTLTMAVDVGPACKVEFKLHYTDQAAARDGETAVRMMLYFLREIIPWAYREALDRPHTDSPDMTEFITQMQTALRDAPVEVKGTDVVGSVALQIKPATLTALFAEVEKKTVHVVSQNNLKHMAIAMHAYHDVQGRLPAAAICDAQGKPLLSWRVAILPYIEEEHLYKQFKLDEPWDSEHNKKLIAKMPKIYAAVQGEARPGTTPYRVFAGNGAAFDLNVRGQQGGFTPGKGFQQFTDGTSNTLMIVEADPVIWTKPEPLPFDPNKPLPKLGGVFKDGFNVATCDGAVHFIKHNTVNAQALRAMITCSGGEVFTFPEDPPRRRGFPGGRDVAPPPRAVEDVPVPGPRP